MTTLDKRLHLYRPDLADAALRGRIDAGRFVEGRPAQVAMQIASVRRMPDPASMQLTEALPGETLKVFDEKDGWSWVKLDRDGYVGHVETKRLVPPAAIPSHEVSVPSTLLYPKADLKTQPATTLPMLSRLSAVSGDGQYADSGAGFVFAKHLRPADSGSGDFVSIAERFIFTPYYWGGKTVHGLDCSGLVQLALQATGWKCPRDSDMQEESLGTALARTEKLRRGDLVFWKGHVGIMADADMLLHANGFEMMVVCEPLADAIARSDAKGQPVTSMKRLQ